MKICSALIVSLLAASRAVLADSDRFGFVGFVEGPDAGYFTIYDEGKDLLIGRSLKKLSAVINNSGKIQFSNNEWLGVEDSGKIVMGGESSAADGFKIVGGRLTYKDSQDFYAVNDNGNTQWYTQSVGDSPKMDIRPHSTTGTTVVADFDPSEPDKPKTTSGVRSGSSAGNLMQPPRTNAASSSEESRSVLLSTRTIVGTNFIPVIHTPAPNVVVTSMQAVPTTDVTVVSLRVPLSDRPSLLHATSTNGDGSFYNAHRSVESSSKNGAGRLGRLNSYIIGAALLLL
ncbi:HHR153Cp [Eremothecium sinecaudum]|uniref:HHR153Cp n=1 Tax=Eremothecium sinecaudum TaxID=45286 RepID=A0A109V0K3_9SACH|nr:HHR153Cp [Eremothecium sinecaudum]AMD22922.1 HHR153Cp [Eremothecium sinecaudum]